MPEQNPNLAIVWYHRAIAYFPAYAKARVHLAEIYASQGQPANAEALLIPALSSRDPEVDWRLADVLIAQQRFEEAEIQLETARSGFEHLLERHLYAFADHAAEFYAGIGKDRRRALEPARANVANRPTRRAVKQVQAITSQCAEGERTRQEPSCSSRGA
ncbi:tetratricopeptide repeat protein [Mesorhizobium sp. ANAO-SY3R2]|uniref:tetratricopeptide repeat protein n=1 Tax=Mesorhizobium sp. ANAO-SY3R2 TaxID=3166644 RepID=UPI00366ABE75